MNENLIDRIYPPICQNNFPCNCKKWGLKLSRLKKECKSTIKYDSSSLFNSYAIFRVFDGK